MLEEITAALNPATAKPDEESYMRLGPCGHAQCGKSSLTNALLQKDQTIVTPIAGTTRDSIDTAFSW
ncbi:MAG: hypothetical protein CM1200mP10_28730 [Candidatus Neomarinimicrobiota bacterium]|nr:MAG: hypothetical protein CM1200mP10_28730 [Candidatus Neomarinimicrobiota bacterium]